MGIFSPLKCPGNSKWESGWLPQKQLLLEWSQPRGQCEASNENRVLFTWPFCSFPPRRNSTNCAKLVKNKVPVLNCMYEWVRVETSDIKETFKFGSSWPCFQFTGNSANDSYWKKKISVWEFRRKNVKTEFPSPAPVLDVGSACLCSSTWWGKAIESVISEWQSGWEAASVTDSCGTLRPVCPTAVKPPGGSTAVWSRSWLKLFGLRRDVPEALQNSHYPTWIELQGQTGIVRSVSFWHGQWWAQKTGIGKNRALDSLLLA